MRLLLTALLLACLIAGPAEATERGLASWYGPGFYGRPMACGGLYTGREMTAAHKSLPCGTRVRVIAANGRSVVVTITDRGPYIRGRIIDLSPVARQKLRMGDLARVTLEIEG